MPVLELPVNPLRRLAMMEMMLDCNFLKLETGKGELSIQHDENVAVYQVALETAALTVDRLDHAIDEFLKACEECRFRLEKSKTSATNEQTASQDNGRFQLLKRLKLR